LRRQVLLLFRWDRQRAELLIEDEQLAQAVQVLNLYRDQQFFDFEHDPDQPIGFVDQSPWEAALAVRFERASEIVGQVGRHLEELSASMRNRQPDQQEIGLMADLEASFTSSAEGRVRNLQRN
jgi:hypothetical protein